MNSLKIGNFDIGDQFPPFVIAELSGNHNQSLEKALRLIDLAADSGAHAIKIQTYTADSMTIDHDSPDFQILDEKSLWYGRRLYELYQEASTPYEWHQAIFEKCHKRDILCFSTPFDEAAVDFLEQFDPPCYKIASFENNHFPLIRKVVSTGKPLIISLGLTTESGVKELNQFLVECGAEKVVLLKCTSAYPARPKDANLKTIPELKRMTGRLVGLSDHTLGTAVSVASVALGSCVIEKHFTDSRAAGGVDSAFSLEPSELRTLVEESKTAWECLGSSSFELSESEVKSLKFKRSIYAIAEIKEGEVFSIDNLRVIRPGYGLEPKYFEGLIGTPSKRDIGRGEPLQSSDL